MLSIHARHYRKRSSLVRYPLDQASNNKIKPSANLADTIELIFLLDQSESLHTTINLLLIYHQTPANTKHNPVIKI